MAGGTLQLMDYTRSEGKVAMTTEPTPPPEPTPFEKFSGFMRKLVAVPKSAIAAEEKKYQRNRAARRARRKKRA